MTDRLKREGNPPSPFLASPVPQYWNPAASDYERVEGSNGASKVTLQGSKTEQIKYGPLNPIPGSPGQFWTPTTTVTRLAVIQHASLGLFDQVIHIRHTLDRQVAFRLRILTDFESGEGSSGTVIWVDTNVPTNSRWTLAPEAGLDHEIPGSGIQKVFAVPELRLPIWRFQLEQTCAVAPTSGTVNVTVERRY